MNEDLLTLFSNCIDESFIKEGVMLSEHSTFKSGGPAKLFISVETYDDLKKVIGVIKDKKVPYFLIGNGSNLLISDKGFDGVVIKLSGDFKDIKVDGNRIVSGAAAMLSRVCIEAKNNALSGLEFAYGIPGTVGGAMVMNAGAYDGEMKNVVKSVELLDENGDIIVLTNEEMEFGYRTSILKRRSMIVLRTVFELCEGSSDEIDVKMQDFMERRRSKQPLEYPSAGSTFKRPKDNYAGKLIMDAGLAGARVGGASVSAKHCGFVINDNNATSEEISRLMKLVEDKVFECFNVKLEPEVIFVGEFDK